MMIACLRLPYVDAAVAWRAHPELQGQPVVWVDAALVVDAVSPEAGQAGIRAGMPVQHAQALCAAVRVLPAVPSRTRDALDRLLEPLTAFSPRVELEDMLELRADGRATRGGVVLQASQLDGAPAATCYLDLGRLTPEDALAVAAQIQQLASEQTGCTPQLGLSAGKFPARVAGMAAADGDVLLVPAGQEAAFLAAFPTTVLPLDGETLRQLDLLGLHTLGQVAALPVTALVDRFGKRGRALHRLANGRDTSPVAEYIPPAVARIRQPFEHPITDTVRLDAMLANMVERVMKRLLAANQTVRQVTLLLTQEDGVALEQQVTLRQPRNSVRAVREVVAELARALPVTDGILAVELVLRDLAPVEPLQLSLFERPTVAQAELTAILDDLIARYGEAHFFRIRAVDAQARLPERRYQWEPVDGR